MKRTPPSLTILLLTLVLLSAVSLTAGTYSLDWGQVFSDPRSLSAKVFFDLRLPRTVCGILCGAALGLTGAVYQSVFSSPLASPDLTGVSSGASAGAALAIVLGSGGAVLRMGLSFAGGMLSLALVTAVVRAARNTRSGGGSGTYILAGILVSSLCEAALMTLKTAADPEGELAALEFWTMGSLAAVKADRLAAAALPIVPALALLLLFRRPAAVLSLGDDAARNSGLNPALWRTVLLSLSTLAVSAVSAAAGSVGFVGLIAPHLARLLHPRTDSAFLVLSLLTGANLLAAADLLARTLSPLSELPLSIFTVIFASPVLLWLLLLRKGGD